MSMFLDQQDLVVLTGRVQRRLQVDWLRKSGIPFFVNAAGRPVVARVAIEGRVQGDATPAPAAVWQSNAARR
ncbi:DUF4224 domain-containing protein [Chitinimonas sp.]|uniref:DUF4224 domain-containing protein n=1 Tax=Chitinimonas sp. TaxID=1934313 RepID=UPI0035B303AD